MYIQKQNWREISKDKYYARIAECEKRYGIFSPLFIDVKREFKKEFIDSKQELITGIMNYIKSIEKVKLIATDDDYDYYQENGTEMVLLVSEEVYNTLNKNENSSSIS